MNITITRKALTIVAAVLLAGAAIVTGILMFTGHPAKAAPDYEAVARDTVSIIYPGTAPSDEQVQQLLPSTRHATDVACDNLAHMPRSEVVAYTNIMVNDVAKADLMVASMERNVCSRK